MGSKDRIEKFCGTTLLAGKPAASGKCQHTSCPITLALRQRILRNHPVLPALGGPLCCPAFRSDLSLRNSLWMRCQLYFRFIGLVGFELAMVILQFCPFVKHFFAREKNKASPVLNTPG